MCSPHSRYEINYILSLNVFMFTETEVSNASEVDETFDTVPYVLSLKSFDN